LNRGELVLISVKLSGLLLLGYFFGPSLEGRSRSSTSDPVWAKWQAIADPITPDPRTATRRI